MTPLDFAGHMAYLWIILGMWTISKKESIGWLFRFVGEAMWTVIGMLMGMSSIWAWGLVFMAMDLWGWLKWRKQ